MAMRRSDHVLTKLRSQQEEKDIGEIHHKAYEKQVRIVWEIDLRVVFGTSLLKVYYLNDLHDASYKTCSFMPMQCQCNALMGCFMHKIKWCI